MVAYFGIRKFWTETIRLITQYVQCVACYFEEYRFVKDGNIDCGIP